MSGNGGVDGGYQINAHKSHAMRRGILPSPFSRSSPLLVEDDHHGDIDETDALITRIRDGIAYTLSQTSNDLQVMQTTRFSIPRKTSAYAPSATETLALSLLEESPATIISTSPSHIVYELGVPVPYFTREGAGIRLIHTPHWWVGKSAAEVRAGPYADDAEIRKASAKVKELATKQGKKVGKTLRELEIEEKINGALRMQAHSRSFSDLDDEHHVN
jgi:hypothetical protein